MFETLVGSGLNRLFLKIGNADHYREVPIGDLQPITKKVYYSVEIRAKNKKQDSSAQERRCLMWFKTALPHKV